MGWTAPHSGWTAARVETLKTMWLEGKGVVAIVEALGGVTRNAVLGKVGRLGLSYQGNPPKYVPAPKPVEKAAATRGSSPKPQPPLPVPPPLRLVGASQPVALIALKSGACKYPVSHPPLGFAELTLFCAEPALDGGVYCEAHAARCYAGQAHLGRPGRVARIDRNVRAGAGPEDADPDAVDRMIA